jgi:hypothetical protein
LRLRNISVGVDFSTFAKQDWLKKCQLVLSGRNLLTVTNYPGLDPEISSGSSNSSFDRGIDHNTIPNPKVIPGYIKPYILIRNSKQFKS